MNSKYIKYMTFYIKEYGFPCVVLITTGLLAIASYWYNPHSESYFFHSIQGTHTTTLQYGLATIITGLVYVLGIGLFPLLVLMAYSGWMLLYKKHVIDELDRIIALVISIPISACWSFMYSYGIAFDGLHGGLLGQFLVARCLYFDWAARCVLLYGMSSIATFLWLRFCYLYPVHIVVKIADAIAGYVFHVDYIPARIIRSIATSIAHIYYGIQGSITYVINLLNGSMVEKESGSLLEDEEYHERSAHVQDILKEFLKDDTTHSGNQSHDVFASKTMVNEHDYDQKDDFKESESVERESTRYHLPNVEEMLLHGGNKQKSVTSADMTHHESQQQAMILEEKLAQFGIKGKVVHIHRGPVITLYEYQLENIIKLSKIVALEDDLAMALQAINIRILAPIPGKSVIGFEVANKHRTPVLLSNIFHSNAWRHFEGYLPLILGENTHGNHIVVDLASMPHLLIAGSTGSGKSVAVNCMLVSLLCACSPEQVKFIIIDPKQLEFSAYEDIAHLLFPIITDSKKAVPVLTWLVKAMEERYELMAEHGVKNIFEYQKLQKQDSELPEMSFIVLIIDELADLMMTTGKDVEDLIARIAQMSRAAGIHMIVATQRPSVDVITGLIKVNFPNRISFKVTSKIDSRTILDDTGAERLLGKGDMLFLDAKNPDIQRIHGAYVSNEEISFLVKHIKKQRKVAYLDISEIMVAHGKQHDSLLSEDAELYAEIVAEIKELDEISISMIQRRFRIGYNRSARIVDALESDGIILPSDGSKMRRVVKS